MAKKSYVQLTYQDRLYISRLHARKTSVSEIARRVGVHKSTISRELRRNGGAVDLDSQLFTLEMKLLGTPKEELRKHLKELCDYALSLNDYNRWNATTAQAIREHRLLCANRLRRSKSPETRKWVIQKLKDHWSPEQIAGRSKIEAPEPLSYEFVYRMLHDDKKRGGKFHRLLKRYRKRKQRFGSREYPSGPRIPNRVGIEQRPIVVDARNRLGDLEGDLIQGYLASGYVVSVVDRKSRLLVLRKVRTKRKRIVRVQLERAIKKMKFAKTLTLDNGSEFCDHTELTKSTQVPVYFAHPYTSSERGTNENSNALVRHFLPKKTCFANLTQSRLNQIEYALNHRPRKCLDYLTPWEVHFNKPPRIPIQKTLHFRSKSTPLFDTCNTIALMICSNRGAKTRIVFTGVQLEDGIDLSWRRAHTQ